MLFHRCQMFLELSWWAKWLREMLVSFSSWDTCLVVCRPQVCQHPQLPLSEAWRWRTWPKVTGGWPRTYTEGLSGGTTALSPSPHRPWSGLPDWKEAEVRSSPGRRGLARDRSGGVQQLCYFNSSKLDLETLIVPYSLKIWENSFFSIFIASKRNILDYGYINIKERYCLLDPSHVTGTILDVYIV